MMIQFNFQKISQLPGDFLRKRKEISVYLEKLRNILKEKNFDFPESFLVLPKESLKELNSFERIFLVGIGGSCLGAQAVYYALKNKNKLNEILFFDSLNPLFFKKNISELKKRKIAVCLISESGKTLETIANFFLLWQILKKYRLNPPRNQKISKGVKVFVVTDKDSPLANFAIEKNWQLFFLARAIVGRYSVFSYSGLLPLGLAEVNIKELLLGAKEANKFYLIDDPSKNPALASALTIFYHWQKGKNIYTNFVFPPELEFFGKWYCQLMAESLGKKGRGMTPTISIGITDFHSLGQLYLDGPKDKLINFVFVKNLGFDFQIPPLEDFRKIFPEIEKKKIWQINSAIFQGMKKVFLNKRIPFTETILEKLDERNLGQLLQMKMIEIILLAKLMKVNAFDQPAVELYKKESRKILKQDTFKRK